MTNPDQNPGPEPVQDNAQAPQAPQEVVQDSQEPAEGNKANREAAKYRTQLRAAEADRDAAQASTARLRAAILDNALTAHGITPAAYRAVTADPEAVIGEDGAVDAETLTANAKAARDALGITVPRPYSSALADVHGGASLSPGRGWGEVLNG